MTLYVSYSGWVSVVERNPTTTGVKLTMTKDKILGISFFDKNEWIFLMPTYLGEVGYWFEFSDELGKEVEFITDYMTYKK